jgi:hypothetical protein
MSVHLTFEKCHILIRNKIKNQAETTLIVIKITMLQRIKSNYSNKHQHVEVTICIE